MVMERMRLYVYLLMKRSKFRVGLTEKVPLDVSSKMDLVEGVGQ